MFILSLIFVIALIIYLFTGNYMRNTPPEVAGRKAVMTLVPIFILSVATMVISFGFIVFTIMAG